MTVTKEFLDQGNSIVDSIDSLLDDAAKMRLRISLQRCKRAVERLKKSAAPAFSGGCSRGECVKCFPFDSPDEPWAWIPRDNLVLSVRTVRGVRVNNNGVETTPHVTTILTHYGPAERNYDTPAKQQYSYERVEAAHAQRMSDNREDRT